MRDNQKDMQRHFEEVDQTGESLLSKEEIKMVCQRLEFPMTDKQIEVIFREYDKDKSGTLDLQEFLAAMTDSFKEKARVKMKCRLIRFVRANGPER